MTQINVFVCLKMLLAVFATQQHKTNTFSRLINEIQLSACNLHRDFALLCTLYYQRHGIEIFSDYSLSPVVTVLLLELKKHTHKKILCYQIDF